MFKTALALTLIPVLWAMYTPTTDYKTVTITWIRDPALVQERLDKYYEDTGIVAIALAEFRGKKCKIYTFEPMGADDKETLSHLGHEVLHCFRGFYHK